MRAKKLIYLTVLLLLASLLGFGQTPTGTIAGVVSDPSGAAIPAARVLVQSKATGLSRTLVTTESGAYSAPALPPGTYEVTAEAEGFLPLVSSVTVEAGTTTTVDLPMRLAGVAEVVDVKETAPQIQYDSHKIDGVVTRAQIQALPLNGRDFLQLAFLEPGVTVSQSTTVNNAEFAVTMLGAAPAKTRVTVDGGDTGQVVIGGSSLGVSQEAVQEFQISTVNFDLSTGRTGAGAVNIVTRSGGNQFHGSGFYFFRDHNMAAYPGLSRDASNPDPFFARRQAGFYLGGPIRKDRLFFFTNLEHKNQDAVVSVQPRALDFAHFGGIFPSPTNGKQVNARFDIRLNANNNAFLRHTHDGNSNFGPIQNFLGMPSNWRRVNFWSDQSMGGLTTVLRPTLIHDLRFAYSYFHYRTSHASSADCPGCLGLGFPHIDVDGTGFVIGKQATHPSGLDQRRYHWADSLSWQKGSHRQQFGVDWEHYYAHGFALRNDPAAMVLYSPESVRRFNATAAPESRIPLPATFQTVEDILRLPLRSVRIEIGAPEVFFGRDEFGRDDSLRFYWQDTWRVRPRFTLNYGIAYAWQAGVNLDLPKPAYLVPILGAGGLAPSRSDQNKWAPSLGAAWSVTKDNKTVIRLGAGIYHDGLLRIERNRGRASLAPVGNGRISFSGSSIPNPLSGIPGAPLGRSLDFRSPTGFTGADLVSILGSLRAMLQRQFGNPRNTDLSVRNIEVTKQGIGPGAVQAPDYTTPYAEHFNIGVEREVARDLVVSADFVFRQYIHLDLGAIDYNHFNSVRDPVLRPCLGSPLFDPKAPCSAGEIGVGTSGGRAHSKGLLVRVDKRFSRRTQFLASYALSSAVGLTAVRNKDVWFDSYGPLDTDLRHIFNLSGFVDLPWGFQVGFISTMASKAPFSATVAGMDFNGDGTDGDVLPGTRWNQFNRGLGKSDLVRLVDDFNRNLAGTKTPLGQTIPSITLPKNFEFGASLMSQDLRVSKIFRFGERYKLTVLGEVFNLLNIANLSGYGNNLAQTSSFGQPANRVLQVFGSGGPRAFQLGARISF